MIIKFIIILFIFVCGLVFITFETTSQHELAHKQIYQKAGSKDITIEWNLFKAETTSNDWYKLDDKNKEWARDMNIYNEIIGYNMASISSSLFLSALIISISIIMVRK